MATSKPAPPTRTFLEKRVHQLENVLESKDKECARKLRALQQKYSTVEVYSAVHKAVSDLVVMYSNLGGL